MAAPLFRIARNPDPASRLAFLLALPVSGEGTVVLACAVDWPGDKDAFCYAVPDWPEDAEVVAEVPVESCRRAGKSIQLTLRRQQRRRSLFVWTRSKGRPIVFWRTPGTMAAARPGLKVAPARGLDAPLEIAVDARERYAWRFGDQPVHLVRRRLPVGDYGVFDGDLLCGVVERKRPANLASDAVAGRLGFALADLEQVPYACLVVDGRLSDVFKAVGEHVKPGWLMSVLAALQVAHPRVPVVYAETRALAEDYAFRWLAAARKRHLEDRRGGGPSPAPLPLPLPDGDVPRRATSGRSAGGGALRSAGDPADPGRAAEARGIAEGAAHWDSSGAGMPVLDRVGRQAEALRQARDGRIWTTADYAGAFGTAHQTAWLDLKDLVAKGRLVAEGSPRMRTYRAPSPGGAGAGRSPSA